MMERIQMLSVASVLAVLVWMAAVAIAAPTSPSAAPQLVKKNGTDLPIILPRDEDRPIVYSRLFNVGIPSPYSIANDEVSESISLFASNRGGAAINSNDDFPFDVALDGALEDHVATHIIEKIDDSFDISKLVSLSVMNYAEEDLHVFFAKHAYYSTVAEGNYVIYTAPFFNEIFTLSYSSQVWDEVNTNIQVGKDIWKSLLEIWTAGFYLKRGIAECFIVGSRYVGGKLKVGAHLVMSPTCVDYAPFTGLKGDDYFAEYRQETIEQFIDIGTYGWFGALDFYETLSFGDISIHTMDEITLFLFPRENNPIRFTYLGTLFDTVYKPLALRDIDRNFEYIYQFHESLIWANNLEKRMTHLVPGWEESNICPRFLKFDRVSLYSHVVRFNIDLWDEDLLQKSEIKAIEKIMQCLTIMYDNNYGIEITNVWEAQRDVVLVEAIIKFSMDIESAAISTDVINLLTSILNARLNKFGNFLKGRIYVEDNKEFLSIMFGSSALAKRFSNSRKYLLPHQFSLEPFMKNRCSNRIDRGRQDPVLVEECTSYLRNGVSTIPIYYENESQIVDIPGAPFIDIPFLLPNNNVRYIQSNTRDLGPYDGTSQWMYTAVGVLAEYSGHLAQMNIVVVPVYSQQGVTFVGVYANGSEEYVENMGRMFNTYQGRGTTKFEVPFINSLMNLMAPYIPTLEFQQSTNATSLLFLERLGINPENLTPELLTLDDIGENKDFESLIKFYLDTYSDCYGCGTIRPLSAYPSWVDPEVSIFNLNLRTMNPAIRALILNAFFNFQSYKGLKGNVYANRFKDGVTLMVTNFARSKLVILPYNPEYGRDPDREDNNIESIAHLLHLRKVGRQFDLTIRPSPNSNSTIQISRIMTTRSQFDIAMMELEFYLSIMLEGDRVRHTYMSSFINKLASANSSFDHIDIEFLRAEMKLIVRGEIKTYFQKALNDLLRLRLPIKDVKGNTIDISVLKIDMSYTYRYNRLRSKKIFMAQQRLDAILAPLSPLPPSEGNN